VAKSSTRQNRHWRRRRDRFEWRWSERISLKSKIDDQQ
jgi:hypothetical protein